MNKHISHCPAEKRWWCCARFIQVPHTWLFYIFTKFTYSYSYSHIHMLVVTVFTTAIKVPKMLTRWIHLIGCRLAATKEREQDLSEETVTGHRHRMPLANWTTGQLDNRATSQPVGQTGHYLRLLSDFRCGIEYFAGTQSICLFFFLTLYLTLYLSFSLSLFVYICVYLCICGAWVSGIFLF